MRYDTLDIRNVERNTLLAKKRLGKNQKVRLAQLHDELSHVTQPPPTPRRAPTGQRADFQGNVYEAHRINRFGVNSLGRKVRRANNSGRTQIQFQRSRIQRARRKQRTGGVR